jgi:hypothetical protein
MSTKALKMTRLREVRPNDIEFSGERKRVRWNEGLGAVVGRGTIEPREEAAHLTILIDDSVGDAKQRFLERRFESLGSREHAAQVRV